MMRIAIRMDDIAPGMDWAKFGRFRALCDRYGVRPLIGVVPDNRDAGLEIDPPREDFFETVKELAHSGWSVAMHGCHHVYTSKSGGLFPLNHLSEFAGLSYEKQSELIRRGRQVLTANGIATDISKANQKTGPGIGSVGCPVPLEPVERREANSTTVRAKRSAIATELMRPTPRRPT